MKIMHHMFLKWILGILTGLTSLTAAFGVEPPQPVQPVPSTQQLAWQRMEMTLFLHFGINTFTDREWGDGKEDPTLFNPADLDANQWVREAKAAGFKLMILTAKHHDGFCLWPSAYTEHSVKNSAWKNGQGDVVREFIDACHAQGMKTGIYLSPWDRNHPGYGDSPRYNKHFTDQLSEISTTYGPIDEFWFDGACGEGPNGKKQVYDWMAYYDTLYGHYDKTVIAICGPDIRWVGNESGVARPGESSVQNASQERHVGSTGQVWYPAECDVSIRPGWFYHASQDQGVKSVDHLLDIYFKSVGRNSVLLLNVPPDQRGLFADADVKRLREFRTALDDIFKVDFASGKAAYASEVRGGDDQFGPMQVVDGNLDSYWSTNDDTRTAWLEIDLGAPRTLNVISVQEQIRLGERVQRYHVEARVSRIWQTVAQGTVIGHKNLLQFPAVEADRIKLIVDQARACPAIAHVGVFYNPRSKSEGSGSVLAHHPVKASNVHPAGTVYGGDKAVDDDMDTRWATSDDIRECWLEVDLQKDIAIGSLRIAELQPRITRYQLEYKGEQDPSWSVAHVGGKAGLSHQATFKPVNARHIRLHILEATFAPTLWEFQVFPAK
ncbi:MAG: alpha-L-fucosidase [Phycisphaerae bacterium]|nr:alpha-L-fucosidase [Phycisphaerae bacterium]